MKWGQIWMFSAKFDNTIHSISQPFSYEMGANMDVFFTYSVYFYIETCLLYTNIHHTLMNLLHGLFNCEIGGLDCRVITTEYITRV